MNGVQPYNCLLCIKHLVNQFMGTRYRQRILYLNWYTKSWVDGSKGLPGTPVVPISSFSCSFQETLTKIIGWSPHFWVGGPHLRNPGSATALNHPNLADYSTDPDTPISASFSLMTPRYIFSCSLRDQSFKEKLLDCSTLGNQLKNKQTNRQTFKPRNVIATSW